MKQNIEYYQNQGNIAYMFQRRAAWFSRKWNIPEEACFRKHEGNVERKQCRPQWYIAFYKDTIVGGIGQ
jgi:hypothetical protein